jgi:hypothetical protein
MAIGANHLIAKDRRTKPEHQKRPHAPGNTAGEHGARRGSDSVRVTNVSVSRTSSIENQNRAIVHREPRPPNATDARFFANPRRVGAGPVPKAGLPGTRMAIYIYMGIAGLAQVPVQPELEPQPDLPIAETRRQGCLSEMLS